jgi:hypothetical protein
MFSLNLKLIEQIYSIFIYEITNFVMLLTRKFKNTQYQIVKNTKIEKIKVF